MAAVRDTPEARELLQINPRETPGIALVTGAGSGIGREVGFTFAEQGASGVVFADINERAAQQAAERSKEYATHPQYRAFAVFVNVTHRPSVESVVTATIQAFGRIDYNVNSAGVGCDSDLPISDTLLEELDRIYNVNTKGVLTCIGAVSKAMQTQSQVFVEGRSGRRGIGRGSIVNIASVSSCVANYSHVQDSSSKFAVLGITKTAALELSTEGIRVNAVCPGWTDTPLLDRDLNRKPEMRDFITKAVGRTAKVEEVASVAHFLCAPGASYVNGAAWLVDGGVTLTIHV